MSGHPRLPGRPHTPHTPNPPHAPNPSHPRNSHPNPGHHRDDEPTQHIPRPHRGDEPGNSPHHGGDHHGGGPLGKLGEVLDKANDVLDKVDNALDTEQDIADNIKKMMSGDPIGGLVGLANDAGQLAQMLMPEAAATPIIEGGMYGLTLVSLGFGMGDPDTGESFSQGAELFQAAGDGLSNAYPNEWHGSAASSYSSRNA